MFRFTVHGIPGRYLQRGHEVVTPPPFQHIGVRITADLQTATLATGQYELERAVAKWLVERHNAHIYKKTVGKKGRLPNGLRAYHDPLFSKAVNCQ